MPVPGLCPLTWAELIAEVVHGQRVVDTKRDRGARARIRCYLTLGPRIGHSRQARQAGYQHGNWTADLGPQIASYQMTDLRV